MADLTSNYPPTGIYPPPPAPAPAGIYYPPPPPAPAPTGIYYPSPPPPAPTGIFSPPPAPAPTGIYSPPPPTPPLPVANSVSVIGPQFSTHTYPIDLAIVRKILTITDGNFVVQDINGNTLFKVKGALVTVHNRRVLLDSAGNPIVTLRKKIMTAHDRWQVFRGESKEPSDLIFTAKRSKIFQLKTKLDVFLANNTKEDVCDFKVKGSWLERSCVIYAGDSSAIVAQMHMKDTAESILLGKDKFMVTVYPNIDYAFIISLIVILDAINSEGNAADVLSEF